MAATEGRLRWRLVDQDDPVGQESLFDRDQLVDRRFGTGEFAGMEFLHVNARTIINQVPASSRMPFRHTINVYRGCSHACSYCFARPTHEYLGLDVGEDFERKIVVKINAVERLRAELAARRWAGHGIAMGTNTDPYQRCEGKYHLTQGVIRALSEAANPFSILTKSTLILRDLDLLVAASGRAEVRANLSIGTLDPEVWRLTEPGTPHPARRVEAVRRLNEAGIRCGVLMAPILPGLSDGDAQLDQVARACVDAGAVSVTPLALHLRPGVREHFLGQLAKVRPDLARDYQRRFRGPYLPAAEQRALSERVGGMVDRARGQDGRPRSDRRMEAPAAAMRLGMSDTGGRAGRADGAGDRGRAAPDRPIAGPGPDRPPADQLALDLSAGS